MRRTFLLPALAAALASITLGAATANADFNNGNDCGARNSRGRDLQVVGLVADGTLVCFEDDRPRRADTIGTVYGLDQDVSLIGIDYRPANNTLYGVGNAGGVYTIDANTAQATLVSRLNQPLTGTNFGVDFNPAVDRLRIVSAETGQNLRVNVDDGTTNVDGTLNIPGATPVNPALGASAVAYTNNDADPNTVTTLFDIDTTNDNVVIQAPANAGSLSPTGKLGVDAASPVGFDIYSSLGYGTTTGLRPLATFAGPDGKTNLYRVDLLAGRVSQVGTFRVPVVDIAIPTDQR